MTTTWRQQQAEATRRQIMAAARRCSVTTGYSSTTIEAIAAAAGVAVPTVYKAFGNKRSIALELNDLIETEADIGSLIETAMGSEDPVDVVELSVRIGRRLHENCGDIIALVHAAADAEPELAAVVAEGIRRQVSGDRSAAGRLAALGALRSGLTLERAAGLLGQLSSAETFATLTSDHGWSLDDAERWLADAAIRLLLQPQHPAPAATPPPFAEVAQNAGCDPKMGD